MYWGTAKRYARDNCNYTWGSLVKTVPLNSIRKFERKSARYMDCYRKGLNMKQAEYTVKRYKSHRKIPDSILTEIDI